MAKFTLTGFADEISADFDEQLAGLRSLGMSHIELRGLDGVNISDLTNEQAREYRRKLDDAGISVSALGSPIGKINILEDFEPHYEKYLHTLELCEIFGTGYLRMFSFYYPKEDGPEVYRSAVIERVGRFVEGAESYPVTLLLENELNLYGDNAPRVLDVLKSIDSPRLRHTFDPANYVLTPQTVYPDAYELLSGYIEYVHIKDAILEPQSIQPAGLGEGRVRDVLAALQKKGFEGFLSLEPHLGSFVGLSTFQTLLDTSKLPQGGLGTFTVAHTALTGILRELGAY